jgi:23S rRNA pseudouridine2605 synthase
MEERLQKILARSGLGSRRHCEALIADGRVRVNGRTATLGSKADPSKDRIEVDGEPISAAEALVYIALYKPRGVLSTVSAPDPRPTVLDLVPELGQIYPVGRLDVDSEGLILLTNDGQLANRLTHPRYGHEKEYKVLVARRPDEQQIETWRRGVVLEDGYRTAPAEVRLEATSGKGAWLRVVMREGRKRQIRETGMQIGLPVVKIIRLRIGNLNLGSLKPREWRYLSQAEAAELKGSTALKTGSRKVRSGQEKDEHRPKMSGESSHPRRAHKKGRHS